jgi:hypothetical protein
VLYSLDEEGLVLRMLVACMLMVSVCTGCGDRSLPPSAPPRLGALTIDQWKQLPIEEKYDEATFERLRQQDDKLQSDRAWNRFFRKVVIPERMKDIPGVPGQ